jgi:hypothetical protein
MPPPPRRTPIKRQIPWAEMRRRAAIAILVIRAAWAALSAAEREEVRQLLAKSRGRPNRLTRDETRRLGRLASRAAGAAAAAGRQGRRRR